MAQPTFNEMPSNDLIPDVCITTDTMRARVIGYGAALADLQFNHPKGWRSLVLGLNTIEEYQRHSPNFGATVGRYANRIRNGRVTIDGAIHQLARNTLDGHHMHGGVAGFSKRNWLLLQHNQSSVTFGITSPNGDEGYPGAVSAQCSYRLSNNVLEIEMTATTDAPTPINLLHHSYFNLDGHSTIDKHQLQIKSNMRTITDEDNLPTGVSISVIDDPVFDFQKLRNLDHATSYDVSYLLEKRSDPLSAPVASLISSQADMRMDISTTEPALHFYDGSKINLPVAGLSGKKYNARSGLCLEPTRMSDAPNIDGFPNAILRPGETYRQVLRLTFSAL